jgi:hypothetical protein
VGVEIGERDAEGEGLLVGLLGGGDADNVVELALAQKLADAVHGGLGTGGTDGVGGGTWRGWRLTAA